MKRHPRALWGLLLVVAALAAAPLHGAASRPLAAADIDAIAQLLKLEDTRQFDEAVLTRLAKADHPEVRRRAVQSIGRIADPRGKALLATLRTERDPEILATVVFSTGQLKDADAVVWLSELLSAPKTLPVVAREAAQALGKFRTPEGRTGPEAQTALEARTALGRYLAAAPTSASPLVVGEALLSSGRFTGPGDLAPIVRWMKSPNVELRWRCAWALYRPRNPAAVPHLLTLSDDPSPEVRFWAVRGLAPIVPPQARGAAAAPLPPPVEIPGIDRARLAARLRTAVLKDTDRRVRTEALRALGHFDDDESFAVVLSSLDSPDTWLSVSAAEVMGRFAARASAVVPKLTAAAGAGRPVALRLTALTPLVTLAPDAAVEVASDLAHEKSLVARSAAVQALGRLGAAGKARLGELSADPAVRDLLPQPGAAQAGRGQQAPAASAARPDADYRRLVEQWVVPDYNGAPKPRAIWETPKGEIELELYAGDAPLGMEYFVRAVESGAIVGTEFGRVVPNFVAQQRTIRDAPRLRDEVSSRGLLRANLSWASSGLDTGRPGYTLGSTPQPHNEGDFTALGHVIRGMDVVDRLELADAVTGARMKK